MFLAILFIAFGLSLLILIHEAGHFFAAKAFGMKVEEFGFGFPPRAWSTTIGETIYSVNWLPIGGFVRLMGEVETTGAPTLVEDEVGIPTAKRVGTPRVLERDLRPVSRHLYFTHKAHKAADREPVERIDRLAYPLAPYPWREAESELLHFHLERLRGEKMSRLVHQDKERKPYGDENDGKKHIVMVEVVEIV